MTTTLKAAIEAKFAEAAETVQYAATNCKASIDKFTATNTDSVNQTLTVHLVPPGGTAGPSNAITKQIAPGATWLAPEIVGHILESGGDISTIASVASKIWIRSSVREFT